MRLRHPWLFVLPFLLLAAAASARGLNATAIWFDEYYSIFESGGAFYGPLSPLELASRVASYSTWPPLYNYTLAGWSALVGWHPAAGRALSWLFGLLSIAAIYRLGRALFPRDQRYSLFAAMLFSTTGIYLLYFHELRGYTLHVLLGCSAAFFFWRSLYKPSSAILTGLVITLTLLLYSHPIGQVAYGALAGYLLLFVRGVTFRRLILRFGFAALLYAPWLIIMALRVAYEVTTPRGTAPSLIITTALMTYTNYLPFILAVGGGTLLFQIRKASVRFLVWWGAAILCGTLIVDRVVPFLFHVRLLMAVLPAVSLVCAYGLLTLYDYARARWLDFRHPATISLVGIMTMWIGVGITLTLNSAFDAQLPGAWKTIAWSGFSQTLDILRQHASSTDAILFSLDKADTENWMNPTLHYYLHDSPLHYSLLSLVNEDVAQTRPYTDRLAAFVSDAPRVWLARDPSFAPDTPMITLNMLLDQHYLACPILLSTPTLQLNVFVQTATDCPPN